MQSSRLGQSFTGFAVLAFLILCLGPALALIQDIGGSAGGNVALLTSRQLVVLANSVIYALVSALGAITAGWFIALFIWNRPGFMAQIIKLLLIIMLPMPAFIHAAGWRAAWRFINDVTGYNFSGQGWAAAVVITIMAFLPIAVGAAWLGLQAVNKDLIGVGRICRSDLQVLSEIILPLSAPFLAAGAAIISVLSLLDYTIPSLCQVNVYALEIFADFSAVNNPGRSFLLALPLIIVNTVIAGGILLSLRNAGISGVKNPLNQTRFWWPFWFWVLPVLGAVTAVVQAGVPFITLLLTALSGETLWRQYGFAGEMAYSIAVAVGVGVIAVLLAYPIAKALNQAAGGLGRFLWLLVLLPLLMPAPVFGIGLIRLGMWIPGVYGSDLMPIMAGLARFLPLAVLIIWAGLKRMDNSLMEAGRVLQSKPGHSFFRVELPLLAPVLLTSFLLLFVLAFGELGASLLVMPPGRSTLTITIYNYLHYGASGSVSVMCLSIALLSCLVWVGGLKSLELGRRVK